MMNIYFLLFVSFIVLFIAQTVLLVFSVIKNRKKLWIALYITEGLSLGLSGSILIFIDKIPWASLDLWSDLAYTLGVFFIAMTASGLYIILIIVSVILNIFKFHQGKKKGNIQVTE